jgi:arsenate reductase (thioredoxin)
MVGMSREQVPLEERPSVLFVCVHNAGRSQMAAAFLRRLAGDRVDVLSAGTLPADSVNTTVATAMSEVGIDVAGVRPRLLDPDEVERSDVVITMGCGDACPVFPGVRYLDWDLPDPSGKPIEEVRAIREEIERRVTALVDELLVRP